MKWHDVRMSLPKTNRVSKNDVYRCLTSKDLILRSIICDNNVQYFLGNYIKGIDTESYKKALLAPEKLRIGLYLKKFKPTKFGLILG